MASAGDLPIHNASLTENAVVGEGQAAQLMLCVVRLASPTTELCPVSDSGLTQQNRDHILSMRNTGLIGAMTQYLPGKICRSAGIALFAEMGMIKQ